jgi:sugar phosphate permease
MSAGLEASNPILAGSQLEAERIYGKIQRHLIPILFICYLANYIDRVNVGFAKLEMLTDLGMSEAVYGLGAGIFFIGYLACGVPSNLILQRVGARRWISVMMVAWGICSASLMFVKTPGGFYLLRFLTGAAEAGFFPGVVLYLTRWFPRARHGRVLTIFMSAIPVSGLIGGPISGLMLQNFAAQQGGMAAWQWMFLLQGLPTVMLGIVVWFTLSDDANAASWLTAGDKSALRIALADDEQASDRVATESFGAVLRRPTTWALGAVYFSVQSGVYAIGFWLPSIIRTIGWRDPVAIGFISAVPYLAAVIFMILMGRSADRRMRPRAHVLVALALGASGLLLAGFANGSPGISLLGITMATMGTLTGLPMFWPLANNHLSASTAAAGFALINSCGQAAGFASPYLVGMIKDSTGSTDDALYILALAIVAGMLIVISLRGRGTESHR